MALQKQNVTAPLIGLDTKTDEKQLPVGKLAALENAVMRKTGELRKRYGYAQLGTTTSSGSTVSSAKGLASFNDELLLISDDTLYSYVEGAAKWFSKGALTQVDIVTRSVVSNSSEQSNVDSATSDNGGVTLYAWQDTLGGVYAQAFDESSLASTFTPTQLDASGTRPRVVACGSFLFVFYVVAGNIYARRLDPANPSALSTAVTVTTTLSAASPYYDVCALGENMVLVYRSSGNQLTLVWFLQANRVGTTLDGVPNATAIAAIDPSAALTVIAGETTNTFHVGYATGALVGHAAYYRDFTSYKAAVSLEAIANTRQVTLVLIDGVIRAFYEISAGSAINYFVKSNTLTVSTNVAGTAAVLRRSVGIAAKAFTMNDRAFVVTSYGATLQATYFVVRDDGVITAKVLAQVGGGHPTNQGFMPGIYALSDTKIAFTAQRKTRLISENAELYTLKGVSQVAVDFDSTKSFQNSELGENLHLSGGYLKAYDGAQVVEAGFHLYPETPALTASGAGGVIATGSYAYLVVWEWIDNRGQVHRSAPSVPVSVSVTGPTGSVDVVIPTLRMTAKTAPSRAEVIAAVYRTTASGTVYYKVSSASTPTLNSTTGDTVTFTDTLADASITSREILYTTGGVLENQAPPACSLAAIYKRRLFVGGLEDRNKLLYSKEQVTGEGVAFALELDMTVNPTGGDVTALSELDDKLIIFKTRAIFALTGDGPLDNGLQQTFGSPQLIAPDVGCVNFKSVARTTQGLYFASEKGIHLLDRSLQTTFIGAPVTDFDAYTITGASVEPSESEVRFTTAEGTTLRYNTNYGQWGTATGQESVASLVVDGQFVFAKSDGNVLRESTETYGDAGAPVASVIETGWISFAGLQGYQRVYRIDLLGGYVGAHLLKVSVAYDFREYFEEVFYCTPADLILGGAFGEGDTFGEGTTYGGDVDGVYNFKMRPARQKCSSIKLKIEDVFETGDPTGGFALSAITFQVGIKTGLKRGAKPMTAR